MLKVEFQKMRDQMQSDMKQTKEEVSRNEQS